MGVVTRIVTMGLKAGGTREEEVVRLLAPQEEKERLLVMEKNDMECVTRLPFSCQTPCPAGWRPHVTLPSPAVTGTL